VVTKIKNKLILILIGCIREERKIYKVTWDLGAKDITMLIKAPMTEWK